MKVIPVYEEMKKKIQSGDFTFAVVGMGYVGLPLAVEAAKSGIKVIGFDIDEEKISKLSNGVSYISDVSDSALLEVLKSGMFRPTSDEAFLKEADVISICVPTPLTRTREPDMRFVLAASETVRRNMKKGQLIILESTTYPGTTREILLPAVAKNGYTVGSDVFVAFSPERVDPGNPKYHIKNTPKVVGGITEKCTQLASEFYSKFIDHVYPVSSPEVAEMTKLLENIFRAVNIALVNEIMLLCDRMGVNVWEVVEAAGTKPFGFMKFYPGPGLGGHCIPIDPFYLSWKAKEFDFWTEFIELAGRISENIPYYVIDKVFRALNSVGKPLKGSTVLVLGLAYKRDIADVRHSPASKIIRLLSDEKARVLAHDFYVEEKDFIEEFAFEGVQRIEDPYESASQADLVLLVTDHSAYDYERLAQKADLVLDTRNAFKNITKPDLRKKIWLL
jgi:UDP-N-acetyl-D-glucosamine dehydrogenase